MATLDDILNLMASHREENQKALSEMSKRLESQQQELAELLNDYVVDQDPTIVREKLKTTTRVPDFAYWYTELESMPGFKELTVRTQNCLKNDDVIYLGDLVSKTEATLLRTPNFGKKSLKEIETWLATVGEELGQELLAEWYEDANLFFHYGYRIHPATKEQPTSTYYSAVINESTYKLLLLAGISKVGELATSDVPLTMSHEDRAEIILYLRQFGGLRPGMKIPYLLRR